MHSKRRANPAGRISMHLVGHFNPVGWCNEMYPAGRARRPWPVTVVTWSWTAALALGSASFAAAPVTIEGGPDNSGQNYEWVVTNAGQSAITQVEFPHYRAALFFAPDGWETSCTNLANVGAADEPGVCRAAAARAGSAIAPGDSRAFRLQCAARLSVPGRGSAWVTFSDGTRAEIPGVSVPQREPISDRYLPAIGLGVIAAIFIAFRALARRKPPVASADPT